MTASEQLFEWVRALAAGLQAMGPAGLALNGALSVMAMLAGWVGARLLLGGVRLAVGRLPGPPTAEKKVRSTRLIRLGAALLNLAAAAAVAVAIGAIWGLDILAWLSRGAGLAFVQVASRVLLLVLVAAAALEAAGFLIGHAIERLAAGSDDPRRAAQLRSFGPLLGGVAQGAILIVACLMLLGDLGVKIGPLLAGAGVVGVAVGFGAQTVVRDLLTGFFLLIEDILAVGDIVRIGDSGGLVEAMTLRTIRLRDFDGTLHVIPYGEAQVVHNLTKTFSYYVFELQVSYGSDLDEALRIMRRTGDEMQREPEYRDRILEPIEVVGVDNLADSGVVLKARIKTRPIEQWNVGREYNRRIKLAFDRAGIEIPFPHLKVVLPDRQLRAFVGPRQPEQAH